MDLSRDKIREQLRATTEGHLALDAFQDWLERAGWNLPRSTPADVRSLAARLQHMMYTQDDDAELLRGFRVVLQQLELPPLVKVDWAKMHVELRDQAATTLSVTTSLGKVVGLDDKRLERDGRLIEFPSPRPLITQTA